MLWEVADVVEQIFCIACVEDLTPTADDRYAAILGFQADHGVSVPQMRERLRSCCEALTEVDQRARQVCLMRMYAKRWRVFDCESRGRFRGAKVFGPQPRKAKKREPRCGLGH